MNKMEVYLEKQCLWNNERSSVWDIKNSEGKSETLINFTKSGQNFQSLKETTELLNIIKGNNPDIVILPDFVSETNHEISFLYRQNLKFHSPHEKETYKYNHIVLLAIDIALALHEIHSSNMIHGGISPDILIKNDKSTGCNILYFANLPFSDLRVDLPHMAPELFSHNQADPRTDLYALGVMLYKMATGILPCFAHETTKMVHHELGQRPVSPSQINKNIPKSLSVIIGKLLDKNPDNRYQTGLSAAHDLIHLK